MSFGEILAVMPQVCWPPTSTAMDRTYSLKDVMEMQAPRGWDYFLCARCRHWGGGCACKRGCFVSVEGADTSKCCAFEVERRKKGGAL